ncbi:MAG: hypothetical protein QJR13_00690 [Bacillota bacterium]|nr:hypothetical protein [Bacillota bacterium]
MCGRRVRGPGGRGFLFWALLVLALALGGLSGGAVSRGHGFALSVATRPAAWVSAAWLRLLRPVYLLPSQEEALAGLAERWRAWAEAETRRGSGEPGRRTALARLRREGAGPPCRVLVASPAELRPLTGSQRERFLLDQARRARRMGAVLVVDASHADGARAGAAGHRSLELLRQAGVARAVLFDGGHHLHTLPLRPDLLLVPVLRGPEGRLYVAHAYLKDALPLSELQALLERLFPPAERPVVLVLPRLIYVKDRRTLAALGEVAVDRVREELKSLPRRMPGQAGEGSGSEAGAAAEGREIVERFAREKVLPLSALDLYRRRLRAFFRL